MKSVRAVSAVIIGLAAVVLSCVPAWAVALLPDTTVLVTPSLITFSDSPAATTSGTFQIGPKDNISVSGTFTQDVFVNVTNGGITGVAFRYTINTRASSGEVNFVQMASFNGFLLDVAWLEGSAAFPVTANRTEDGEDVSFNYVGGSGIGPTAETSVLLVQTDADGFGPGGEIAFKNSMGSGDGVTKNPLWQPTTKSVPEPGTLLLLASGLAVAGVWGRKSLLKR